MGLFDFLFKNRPYKDTGRWNAPREEAFRMLNGYVPKFTSWEGGLYESELIRSAIWTRANHISKLNVEIHGSAKPALQNKLKHGPNRFQTWGQFLARASVILDVHNTCLVCPIYDEYGQPSGYFTPLPRKCEVVQVDGVPYLRYEFAKGERAAIEMDDMFPIRRCLHAY